MMLARRAFLELAVGAAALPGLPRIARAQAYPKRPVHVFVGNAPGGATDVMARLVGEWLSRRLGQPFVVENRPGSSGSIAADAVLRSQADGYALFMAATANVTNAQHEEFVHNSAAVAMVGQEPIILSINPLVPAKTLPEFIAYAKSNPGKLSMASPGTGTMPHIAGELFKLMVGIDMVHVPFHGGSPALTAVAGGQVQVAFMGPAASMSFIKAGTIRALAVTSGKRAAEFPDIPAIGEVVSGYEANQWFGFVAPKATPPEIVNRLNTEINAGLADSTLRERLTGLGETVAPQSAAVFSQRIAADAAKWAKVIEAAHITI